eukprot:5835566-Pleurochrysis_carterae.AAC.1
MHTIQVQPLPLIRVESANDRLEQFRVWLRFRSIAQKAQSRELPAGWAGMYGIGPRTVRSAAA